MSIEDVLSHLVHYINNPTPAFSSHLTLVLSPPVISSAISFHLTSVLTPTVLPPLFRLYINLSHEELLPCPRDETDHTAQGCDAVG